MKKYVKFLLPFLVASSTLLTGCKDNEESNKILLSFGDVNATTFKEIEIEDLNTLCLSHDNFMIVVRTTTCGCWRDTRDAIEPYIKENKVVCYSITYEQYKASGDTFGLTKVTEGTTTFAIFENGAVKYCLNSSENDQINSASKFKAYMDETIIKPAYYFITEENYQTIKESDKNAIVYFERSKCGDCTYINPHILRDYALKHPNMNRIYVLDCQPWKSLSETDYQAKKDQFGLSNEINKEFGYDTGVFPFFSYLESGEYKSGAVAFNDKFNLETNKLDNCYYTAERVQKLGYNAEALKDHQFSASDLIDGKWSHEAAEKFYNPIIESFLDYALPKVTFIF